MPRPSCALRPPVLVGALLLLLVVGGAAAQQAAPPEALISMTPIMHGVATAKAEVRAALSNPAAAFDAYLARFVAEAAPAGHVLPGGPADSMSQAERLQLFTANLERADGFNTNSSNALVARGITHFAHLTQAEFAQRYLGQNFSAAAGARPAMDAAAAAADGGPAAALDAEVGATQPSAASRRLLARTAVQFVTSSDDALAAELTPLEAVQHAALPPAAAIGDGAAAMQQQRQCSGLRNNPYYERVPPEAGVDWVAAGGTAPVRDQGPCGSCVAFATTALAEFMHMRKFGTTNTTTDLSEQDLLECTLGNGCHGQHQEMYVEFIACNGIAAEADQPYTATNDADNCKPLQRYSAIAANNGGGYAFVAPDVGSMRQALSAAPVMISVDASDWALYRGGVLDCEPASSRSFNHAIVLVGFFAGVQQHDGRVQDLFLIRNSWGTWWGSGNGPQYAGHVLVSSSCVAQATTSVDDLGIVPLMG